MDSKTWETAWKEKESHSWWSVPDIEVEALIESLMKKGMKRVLDLGFGIGRHVILFSRKGFETYGIEPTHTGFSYCKEWLETEGLKANIRIGEMTELPYEDGFFDFVLSWNVVYHGTIDDLIRAMAEIYRVTAQGGMAYITLNSTKNKYYGQGTEIETNTFLNPMKTDGDLPHHYSDKNEVLALFEKWEIIQLKEQEEVFAGVTDPNSYHWMILISKK